MASGASMADTHITIPMARLIELETAEHERDILRADKARLAREAHTWWTAARDAAATERRRCALRVALHSQYPITTDFDRGYAKARKDAAETLRTMDDEPARPPTPVGWSDTDWLAHLEDLRQSAEARYAKGPLPECGWD